MTYPHNNLSVKKICAGLPTGANLTNIKFLIKKNNIFMFTL